MRKIAVIVLLFFACIECFSQDSIKRINSTLTDNDPKTEMWKKIRAEAVKNDSSAIQFNRFPDPNTDPKTIMWNKQRAGLINTKSNSKTYTNEEILIIEQEKKNNAYKNTN